MTSPSKALSRFTVLDLTRVRAGPTCVRQFADWGANVIMVEMPESLGADSGGMGRRDGSDFQNLHRNKRSITLDLKKPEGVEVFHRLVKKADVVVENYRPDVKFRLGVDYESLKKINPRVVYTSISGFGQDGPYAERPGVDQIAQGMSGLMSITGEPGKGPVRAGIAIADVSAGLCAAIGTLTAVPVSRQFAGFGETFDDADGNVDGDVKVGIEAGGTIQSREHCNADESHDDGADMERRISHGREC